MHHVEEAYCKRIIIENYIRRFVPVELQVYAVRSLDQKATVCFISKDFQSRCKFALIIRV
jgi:hypothetical protein